MGDDGDHESDLALLGRYARTQDADAFAELVRRHAGLVYGTCLRVLGNVHDAKDVTQECFLEMARRAAAIRSSLGGWLHALATCRSRNALRNARTRRDHEAKTALEPDGGRDPAWAALEPLVDREVEALPDDLRVPLVLHYLRGLNQQQVAAELGVSQATVSRRLDAGVERLRRHLSNTGVVVSVAALPSLLTVHTTTPVPAPLMAGLGKLALPDGAQAPVATGAWATATGLSASVKALACAAGVGLLGAVGYAVVRQCTAPRRAAPAVVAQAPPQETTEVTPVTDQTSPAPVLLIGNGRLAIPRFPRRVERVDAGGQALAAEEEPPWHDHIVGCLHVALRMNGHDLPWPVVFAASGHPWRFAFDRTWAHDVEHLTPVDALAEACDRLGFEYTALYDRPWPEVREAIAAAIADGRPVLAGLDPRFWCIIVGLDPATGEYLTIGGAPYRHWKPYRAKVGETVPDTLTPAECVRRPIPPDGFAGAVLGPVQFARNPVFIPGPRATAAGPVLLRRVLEQAVALMAPGTIERRALDLRRALAAGADVAATPRAGTIQTGNDAIRAWAAALEDRAAPTHDFGFIHAVDTSLGMQLRGADTAAEFLEWAAAQRTDAVKARLLAAAQRLRDASADPAILTGYNGYLPDSLDPAVLRQAIAGEPRLSYIAAPAQREVLERMGFSVQRCPWGLSVLPDQATFETARARAAERLRTIAAERDEAGRDLSAALDEETREPRMVEPIQMTPPISQNGNLYARGMAAILAHLGSDLSYDEILGLTGVAFILQVDTSGPFLPAGGIDAAWWPNDPWGFHLGLPVLSCAAGWELRAICTDAATYRADPEAVFRRVFAGPIEQSLRAGKPALTYGFVITGMDDQPHPLSGYGTSGKSTRYSQETLRLPRQPWDLCVVGERRPVPGRAKVDGQSLRHIVALFNEQAQGADAPPTRFAGRRAWAEWLKMLYEARDRGEATRYRSAWDNNVLIHLRYNRAAAVAYLRGMAGRHTGRIAERLTDAADLYQRALDELREGELPHPGPTRSGLPAYIAMAEDVLQLETAAMALLDDAAGQLEGAAPVAGR